MVDVFIWYGIIFLIGILAYPISFKLFSRLPDRGYVFSRPLGLLLSGLIIWWGGCLGLVPFLQVWSWVAVGLLALISGVILTKQNVRQEIRGWFAEKANLKYVVVAEMVFIAAFAFMVNLRSFYPQLNASEKFFDLAFINAIATSPTLPPPDPWYGGQSMNYYYGGQYLIGFLCKLSGTEAATAYNIAMGLVYGLLALVWFGLVANLTAKKGKVAPFTGLLGPLFIVVFGNLHPLRQLLTGGFLPIGNPNFPFKVDWPGSARMIYDPMPGGKLLDILTEYPVYSYLNGDLHAHMLGAPYLVMALALIVQLFITPGKWVLASLSWRTIPRFLATGMVFGALYFINMGDFPTLTGLVLLALLLLELKAGDKWRSTLVRVGLQGGVLVASIYLVYIFQFLGFTGMLRGKPMPDVESIPVVNFLSRYVGLIYWPGTNLSEFLVMFGLALFPVTTFLVVKYSGLVRREQTSRTRLILEALSAFIFLVVGWQLHIELLGPVLGLVYLAARLFFHDWKRHVSKEAWILNRMDLLVLLLLGLGGVITLFCEILYVRDIYNNRFNTVFKYWYQLWVFYGLSGVYSIWRVFGWFRSGFGEIYDSPPVRRSERRPFQTLPVFRFAFWWTKPQIAGESDSTRFYATLWQNETVTLNKPSTLPKVHPAFRALSRGWKYGWFATLMLLAISAAAVPTLAYWQTTNGYTNRIGLDGELWYSQQFPAEYKAMVWLRDYTANQTDRRGIVLEANGMNYSWANRVSTYTGLPTIVGWPFHELQWRGNLDEKVIWENWLDMDRIYKTTDSGQALELLKQHNVRYVFVGQVENGSRSFHPDGHDPKEYSAEALAKFGTYMKTIYADPINNVYIYSF